VLDKADNDRVICQLPGSITCQAEKELNRRGGIRELKSPKKVVYLTCII
jgi:hypothetical protein